MSINENIDENETVEQTIDDSLEEMSKEAPLENVDAVFDDDFEIRYEGDFPDLPKPKDDNYKDVLASLSELDNTRKIDYLEENYTASFDIDENEAAAKASDTEKSKPSPANIAKAAVIILILAVTGILFALLGKYL